MNFTRKLFCSSLVLIFLLQSCNKNIADEYPEETGCEKFAGEYLMYDPVHDTTYTMTIECIPRTSNIYEDTLSITNYANQFNLKHPTSPGVNDPGHMSGTIIQPLVDIEGLSWSFGNVAYAGPEDRYNRIVGDSLYITFSIDNSAYYLSDGVPYYSCNVCTHYGVKVH